MRLFYPFRRFYPRITTQSKVLRYPFHGILNLAMQNLLWDTLFWQSDNEGDKYPRAPKGIKKALSYAPKGIKKALSLALLLKG